MLELIPNNANRCMILKPLAALNDLQNAHEQHFLQHLHALVIGHEMINAAL